MRRKSRFNVSGMFLSGIVTLIIAVLVMVMVSQYIMPVNTTEIAENQEYVRIAIDEFPGWYDFLYANGGELKTTKNSINAQNGIYVEYVIVNEYTESTEKLISGDIAGSGYTINKYAGLQHIFDEAGVEVIMPVITNYSNGADGIISKAAIQSVEDLVDKKIAVPKFSEAQTLLEYLLSNSELSEEEKVQIHNNMVFFDTAEETGMAFFSGLVDAAATWEPYLSQAAFSTNSRILFDTSMAPNLVMAGLVFRKDFVDNNEDFIVKLIDGAFQGNYMYMQEFKTFRAMPMFESFDDDEIKEMAQGVSLASCADNLNVLDSTAVTMYKVMANIWLNLGEKADPDKATTAFTRKYVEQLKGKFANDKVTSFTFSSEGRQAAQQIENNASLLRVRLDIKFDVDSYKISQESFEELREFAETAKILSGVYIQIEGNTAKVDGDDGKDFSYKRARSVAKFLQGLGIDPARFVIIGNGDTKPIDTNLTEEGKANNRRTEVFFKVVGY